MDFKGFQRTGEGRDWRVRQAGAADAAAVGRLVLNDVEGSRI
jgi:hypothetical protein